MKVLIVSGIWPPDVGGPASHAPDLAAFLVEHGHRVHVLTTADRQPAPEAYPVAWVSRRLPPLLRHAAALARIRRLAAASDVVYSTGMFGRAGIGASLAGTPLVVKLTADPAFERSRRLGLATTLEEFQRAPRGITALLRAIRNRVVRSAAHVVTPSAYLAELARNWGAREVTVLPNPAPDTRALRDRDTLRAELGLQGPTVAYAGRLVAQKSLELAIGATRTAGVALVIAGDGPDRAELEQLGHARFLGAVSRERALELFRAADASVLSSSWENFPHGAVESLAVGTPVVATDVGGVTEVVHDGQNGLVVPPGDEAALAAAFERIFAEPGLLERLRTATTDSVSQYSRETVFGRLIDLIADAAS